MSTATIDEVRSSLPELLKKVRMSPVFIREGEKDVAVLVSPQEFDRSHLAKVEAFERSRDAMASTLERNLARDGITAEEFVKDLIRYESL